MAKEQCFYFSFRLHGTGVHFTHSCSSKVLQTDKLGEHLNFDPSFILTAHELMVVGDILLKDVSVCHRGH